MTKRCMFNRPLARLVRGLELIRDRYFRNTSNGMQVVHAGHCNIYRSLDVYDFCFCSCGLLHDLDGTIDDLIDVIYPDYWKDYHLQEYQEDLNSSKEKQQDIEEAEKVLVQVFGLPDHETMEV